MEHSAGQTDQSKRRKQLACGLAMVMLGAGCMNRAAPPRMGGEADLPPIGQREKIRFFWCQWQHFEMSNEQLMSNLRMVGATVFADWGANAQRARMAHSNGIHYFCGFATARMREPAEKVTARLAVDLHGLTCPEQFQKYKDSGGNVEEPWGRYGEHTPAYVPCPLDQRPWDEALKPVLDLARQGLSDGLHLDLEPYGAYWFDTTGEGLCYCDDCFAQYLKHRKLDAAVERKARHGWLKQRGKVDDYLGRLRDRMIAMCRAIAADVRQVHPTFAFSVYGGFDAYSLRASWRTQGMAIGFHAPEAPYIVVNSTPYWENPTRPWWDGPAEAYRRMGIKHVMGSWDAGIMGHHKESHVGAAELMYELAMASDGFWRWGERDYDTDDWRSFAMVNQRLRRVDSRLGEFFFGGSNVDHFVTLVEQTGNPFLQRPLVARTWERDGRYLVRIFNGNTEWPIHVRARFPRLAGKGAWRLRDPMHDVNYVKADAATWTAGSLREGVVVPLEGRGELFLMLEKAPRRFRPGRSGSVQSMELRTHRPRPAHDEQLPDVDAPLPPGAVLYTASTHGGYRGEPGVAKQALVTAPHIVDIDAGKSRKLFGLQGYCHEAAFSPDRKRVVCAVTVNGRSQIYLINVDGPARNISSNSHCDRAPRFWPDGTKIVFTSDRDGDWEIYAMHADGSEARRLTDSPGIDRAPAVSPDGGRIAFISDRRGDLDVYVMNSDGTDQRSLAAAAGNEDEPTWSPDGSRIACTVLQGQFRSIRIAGVDGSDVHTLGHGQTTDLSSIRFSPDGSQMAGAFSEYGDSGVLVLDLESGKIRKLLKVASLKPHPQGWYTTGTNRPRMVAKTFSGVSFSPDGHRLVYCSDQSDGGQFMLYTIPLQAAQEDESGDEGAEKPEEKQIEPTPVAGATGAWPMTTDWAQ